MYLLFRWIAIFAAVCIAPASGFAQTVQLPTLEPVQVEVDLSTLPPKYQTSMARDRHAPP